MSHFPTRLSQHSCSMGHKVMGGFMGNRGHNLALDMSCGSVRAHGCAHEVIFKPKSGSLRICIFGSEMTRCVFV